LKGGGKDWQGVRLGARVVGDSGTTGYGRSNATDPRQGNAGANHSCGRHRLRSLVVKLEHNQINPSSHFELGQKI
jgi:hypothetical protein